MNRKTIVLLASAAALSLLFTACGAAPKSMSSTAETNQMAYAEEGVMDMVAPAAPEAMNPNSGGSGETRTPLPPANRKVIMHSALWLETMEFDKALNQISALVAERGGYIESQSVEGYSMRNQNDFYERSASISARVPSDKLSSLTDALGTLCNITSRNDSSEDITDTYFDTQAHLETLKIREERLLDILSKAEKLEEVITLETALSDVRYEIESLTAAMKRMDSAVDFSYLQLTLSEVSTLSPTVSAPKTFGEKFALSAAAAVDHLTGSTQGIVLVLVEILPVMLLWSAIIAAIALPILRFRRKKHAKVLKLAQDARDARDAEDSSEKK